MLIRVEQENGAITKVVAKHQFGKGGPRHLLTQYVTSVKASSDSASVIEMAIEQLFYEMRAIGRKEIGRASCRERV